MQPNNSDQIEYKTTNGWTFHIRAKANRRDQSEANIALGSATKIEDGKFISVNVLQAYPLFFKQFVVAWSEGPQKTGNEILNAVYAMPADPTEDVIMVIGSFIYNHVEGLTIKEKDLDKKKA